MTTNPPPPVTPPSEHLRSAREQLLLALTQIPTAAGHEQRVMKFMDDWLAARSDHLQCIRDSAGNYLITQRRYRQELPLILMTAHLDHPAFVVTEYSADGTIHLEFRGGVNDPYFVGAEIEIFAPCGERIKAEITTLDSIAKPFKRVTAHAQSHTHTQEMVNTITPGCIARWNLPPAEILDGLLHTHACDDLAAAAAALAALDECLLAPQCEHLGLLFTVSEEIGFVGAIHAARNAWIPKDARLLCLENSRSFPHDSPIGAGAILRVGDRISVFNPQLTNHLAHLYSAAAKSDANFTWQRKLMAGGGCEASAFACYGYISTCLCLPLGNYHNMVDIAAVDQGQRPACIGREFISINDFHSLIAMLIIAAQQLDCPLPETTEQLMERLYAERSFVIAPVSQPS